MLSQLCLKTKVYNINKFITLKKHSLWSQIDVFNHDLDI